jgi:hypothetical protein
MSVGALRVDLDDHPELIGGAFPTLLFHQSHTLLEVQVGLLAQGLLSSGLPAGKEGGTQNPFEDVCEDT